MTDKAMRWRPWVHRFGFLAVIVAWVVGASSLASELAVAAVHANPPDDVSASRVAPAHSDRSGPSECWALRAVNRARLLPRPGHAHEMVGGTIQGSNESPTSGFVVLATVDAAPEEGRWTDLRFRNSRPFRYVKYYSPPGGHGQIAEIEFYASDERVIGAGFGTEGTRSGNPWPNALDGDPRTFFDGALPSDEYVGMDLAAGHVAEAPAASPAGGTFDRPQSISLRTTSSDVGIRYSLDGTDPRLGAVYAGPFEIGPGVTVVRAIALGACMFPSPVGTFTFTVGAGARGSVKQASLHVGNSLTDTIDGYLLPIAESGGVTLDYSRYTLPGAGTWLYREAPTGGFGVPDVRATVGKKPLDHVTFQPFPNMPCLPTGGASTPGSQASDATNIAEAWDAAAKLNRRVQMWIYEPWPAPAGELGNCIVGGAWQRDPAIWSAPAPTSWDAAEAQQLRYMEVVQSGLTALRPERPRPFIIPGGRGLVWLERAVKRGDVPGLASSSFFPFVFSRGGSDIHLTNEGRYFVSLLFYGAMFQRDPRLLPDTNLGTPASLTAAQAAALQAVAHDVLNGYALSGFRR